MDQASAEGIANSIYKSAKSAIIINGVGGQRWVRNVAKGARIGPWLQAEFQIVDRLIWMAKGACLYFVSSDEDLIKYVGISRNRLKDRWRISPAYEAVSKARLPSNQLFHSQCWKNIERESALNENAKYEVRAISAAELVPVLDRIGAPVSAFSVLKEDGESVVASVERWICNHRSPRLAAWNVAMTAN